MTVNNKKKYSDRTFLSLLVVCILLIIISGYISLKNNFPLKPGKASDGSALSGILVRSSENPGIFFDIHGFLKGDKCYIFLPESADTSNLGFYTTDADGNIINRYNHDFTEDPLEIDGIEIITMESDLPVINLNLYPNYPSLEELESSNDHHTRTKADFKMDNPDGSFTEGIIEMRGRGNTSWSEAKKSYQIKFEKNTDLLDMGAAKSWILLANAGDYSLLRNEVFLDLARDLDLPYTSELEEVNLFINGEYRGAYSLAEKVEVGRERVHIEDGDYLYRIGMDPDKYSFLAYTNPFAEGEGNFKKLYGELRNSKDSMVIHRSEKYLKEAMNELYNSNSDLSLIDMESLAKYYWLQEFSKTTDPTGRSVYLLWSASNKKMYVGPAWDYDRTAGIIDMPFLKEDYIWPNGWTARVRDYYVPLFKNPRFIAAINDTYENGGVKEAFRRSAESIPERVSRMSHAAEMNFIRWDIPREENNQVYYAYHDTSWCSQTAWLHDWLSLRCDFIEKEMSTPQ